MDTILILFSVPLVAALASAFLPRERQSLIEYIAIGATALEAALVLFITRDVLRGVSAPDALFAADALSAFALLFMTTVGLAAAVHSVGHLREEKNKGIIGFRRIREYYVLFHLFFLAMFAATATTSPLVTWIAIETTTLAAVFLITFYNKPSALEAGWKLLIINSVGLLLGFLGTLFFLHLGAGADVAGTFVSWKSLGEVAGTFDPVFVKVAFVFVLIGFGTKVGFVPMHTWLPDAHSKAPVPISALLSGVLLNIALIAVLRFKTIADVSLEPHFTDQLLIGFGVLSLVLAAFIIFVQKKYKRMLAYSSVEHMGIMGLGFGIGGLGTVAALYHMFYHALLKPVLFFAAGNFFLKYSSTKIDHVRGAITLLPISSAVFMAGLFAIAGVPPSGIFFTKLSILAEGITPYPVVMLIAVAALAIVFAGFVRHITNMLYSPAPDDIPPGEAGLLTVLSIGFLAAIFVITSIWIPAPFETLINNAGALIK
jgi:hydrogenase-4 component F